MLPHKVYWSSHSNSILFTLILRKFTIVYSLPRGYHHLTPVLPPLVSATRFILNMRYPLFSRLSSWGLPSPVHDPPLDTLTETIIMALHRTSKSWKKISLYYFMEFCTIPQYFLTRTSSSTPTRSIPNQFCQ